MRFTACPCLPGSVIEESEIGASTTILAAGYNIDSLLFRYQVSQARSWFQRRLGMTTAA